MIINRSAVIYAEFLPSISREERDELFGNSGVRADGRRRQIRWAHLNNVGRISSSSSNKTGAPILFHVLQARVSSTAPQRTHTDSLHMPSLHTFTLKTNKQHIKMLKLQLYTSEEKWRLITASCWKNYYKYYIMLEQKYPDNRLHCPGEKMVSVFSLIMFILFPPFHSKIEYKRVRYTLCSEYTLYMQREEETITDLCSGHTLARARACICNSAE